MSIDYMIKTPDAAAGASYMAEVTQADNIRSAMSVDNLLAGSTDAPDITSAIVLALPSTPKSTEEETSSPITNTPDTVMIEPVSKKSFSARIFHIMGSHHVTIEIVN
jgi:hypothetical protein